MLSGVALLAEGVDRNYATQIKIGKMTMSPSSRRAWIEILMTDTSEAAVPGRPPRGGRG